MWCPRCNQGKVLKAKIIKNEENILICEECDAIWRSESEFKENSSQDFSQYVKNIGLEGLWTELKIDE